jgi:signal transduction histidine kinase
MRVLVHEMRNQLAIAVANVEACIDGKLAPTENRLKSVLLALKNLDELIEGIPKISDVEIGAVSHPRKINLCVLVATSVEGLKTAAQLKNIQMKFLQCTTLNAECRDFYGDPLQIGQIISNVLLNAVLYTPEGGSILFDCHRGPGSVNFTIEDTGKGLSDNDLLHIFDSGYRGSASTGTTGSGIGLAVVKQYLEQYGGSIHAERRLNGTAFHLQLTNDAGACNGCTSH